MKHNGQNPSRRAAGIPMWLCAVAMGLAFGAGWLVPRAGTVAGLPVAESGRSPEVSRPASRARDAAPLAEGRLAQDAGEIAAAFRDAAMQMDGSERAARLWVLTQGLTAANAEIVVPEALKTCAGRERDYFLVPSLFSKWGLLAPAQAVAYVQDMPRGNTRDRALVHVLQGWAGVDFDAAMRYAQALPAGDVRRSAERNMIEELAKTDPSRALALAVKDGWSGYGSTLFPRLARNAPEVAARLAEDLPEGELRNTAIRAVGETWGQRDRAAALEWVMKFPANPQRQAAVSSMLQTWMADDFEQAHAWLARQPAGTARDGLLGRLVYDAAGAWSDNALRLIDLVSIKSSQDSMLRIVAGRWGRDDPAAARLWADGQVDPDVQRIAWHAIVAGAQSGGIEQAMQLVDAAPAGLRAGIVGEVAARRASQDPQGAAEWAMSLDPRMRFVALRGVMRSWTVSDSASSRAWIERSSLSAEIKDVLLGRTLPR